MTSHSTGLLFCNLFKEVYMVRILSYHRTFVRLSCGRNLDGPGLIIIPTKMNILYECRWLRLCLDASVIFVGRKSLKAIQMTNTKIRKIGRPITKVLCQDLRLFHRSFHDNAMAEWGQNCYEVAFVRFLFSNNLTIYFPTQICIT